MSRTPCLERLPFAMQNDAVLRYAGILQKRKASLVWKRILEWLAAFLAFAIVSPFFLLICLLVKCTSKGPVFFKQERIGKNGRPFYILKFRTMMEDADRYGVQRTTGGSLGSARCFGKRIWTRCRSFCTFCQGKCRLLARAQRYGAMWSSIRTR